MKIISFEIRNFRAFPRIHLDRLQRVNLIAGENNVGKTALLEAIWQFTGPDQPDIGLRLGSLRGIDWVDEAGAFLDMFHKFDATTPVEMIATTDIDPDPRTLRLETRLRRTSRTPVGANGPQTVPTPTVARTPIEIVLQYEDAKDKFESRGWFETRATGPGIFQTDFQIEQQPVLGRPVGYYFSPARRNPTQEEADTLGKLKLLGKENLVIEAVRRIEPRLRRLLTISTNGVPVIHADLDGLDRLIPVRLLGEGTQRLLSLALAFGTASEAVFLIDEIENGIHHSRMKDLWQAIVSFSERFDVQVFATTHSAECVQAAHEAFTESGDYAFRFIRLDHVDGRTVAKAFDEITLGTAIDAGFDVR